MRAHDRNRAVRAWQFVGLLAVTLLAGLPAAAAQSLDGRALVDALRAGGLNIYFRHAATEWSQSDDLREAGDWALCEPQRMRQLSSAGRAAARAVGEAMRALRIPVGGVHASPYCRTVQTAELLGVGPVQTTLDVMNLRAAAYAGGREAIIERARARLSAAPAPGVNEVYVAHGNVAVAATTVYPGEGEALVFRPLGAAGFEFVGRLPPPSWVELARE